MMKYTAKILLGGLAMVGALALNGCSTNDGPSHHDVIVAYTDYQFFNRSSPYDTHNYKKRNFPSDFKRFEKYGRVQSCKKKDPGLWVCSVYIKDGRHDELRLLLALQHEGSRWRLNRAQTRRME